MENTVNLVRYLYYGLDASIYSQDINIKQLSTDKNKRAEKSCCSFCFVSFGLWVFFFLLFRPGPFWSNNGPTNRWQTSRTKYTPKHTPYLPCAAIFKQIMFIFGHSILFVCFILLYFFYSPTFQFAVYIFHFQLGWFVHSYSTCTHHAT